MCAVCRAGNPDRFYEAQSEIAKDIADLARRVSRRSRPVPSVTIDISDIVTTGMLVTGRRIVVQKRQDPNQKSGPPC